MRSPLEILKFRGNDTTGYGYYGAKRGTRKHKGVDLISIPGEDVFASIHGIVTKLGQVYEKPAKFKYVEITNDVYRIRLMYCKPSVKLHQRIFECDVVGTAQDIAGYWNSKMKNHIHVEVYKHGLLTDAEPILKLSN